MSGQALLAFMAEGLMPRPCRSVIGCRKVDRFPDLEVVEMVPYCETCERFVPVKELL